PPNITLFPYTTLFRSMEISQLGVVEPKQAEHRAVDIADRMRYLDGFFAGLVCRANHVAGFHATAGKPHRHRRRVVIPPPYLAPADRKSTRLNSSHRTI